MWVSPKSKSAESGDSLLVEGKESRGIIWKATSDLNTESKEVLFRELQHIHRRVGPFLKMLSLQSWSSCLKD